MSESVLKVLKWILGALLVVGAGAALLLHFFTKQKGLGKLAVNALEAAHKPVIEAKQRELEVLEKDLSANAKDIDKAKAEVAKRKEDLETVYKATGMSTDEVVERLEKLRL